VIHIDLAVRQPLSDKLAGMEWRVALALVASVAWAASDFALACWRALLAGWR